MSMWRNVGESFSILGFSSWQQGHFKIGQIEYWSQVVLNKQLQSLKMTKHTEATYRIGVQLVVQITFWGQVLVLNTNLLVYFASFDNQLQQRYGSVMWEHY
eukprot:TRINITY_DN12253_c0_g1_i3.p3 TRINITY_DN12253_c0_g1~~TRINITY_DN12253_c0_g1_i3.p3  ORF type:complete len:101 (-),score=7.12 TRINITY_DN12253_c0_g1_i3:154-456(-)